MPIAFTNSMIRGCERQFFVSGSHVAACCPASASNRRGSAPWKPMIACLRSPTTIVGTPAAVTAHTSANCSGLVSWNSSTTRQSTRLVSVVEHGRPLPQQLRRERDHVAVVDEPRLALRAVVVHQHFLTRGEQRLDVPSRVRQRSWVPRQRVRRGHHGRGAVVVAIRQCRTPLRLPEAPQRLPELPVPIERVVLAGRVQVAEVLLQRSPWRSCCRDSGSRGSPETPRAVPRRSSSAVRSVRSHHRPGRSARR